MPSSVSRPGSGLSCLHRPTRNRCSFEHLIRNFWLNGGNNALAPSTPKSSANGTIAPATVYGRINRIKIDPEAFLQLYPDSRPLPGNPDFIEFNTLPTAALDSGHCYIQDPSTAIACQLLDPKPGERILDACAAPGGKTAYLAQLMQNRGVIIACDRDRERLQILKDNVDRLGASIVRAVRHDWTTRSSSGRNSVNRAIRSCPFGCAMHKYGSHASTD